MRGKTKKILLLVTILLLFIPLASAKHMKMKLLAVSATPDGNIGKTADLAIDIAEGSGRIYLDTFPFTKLDTQMSTRFANEITCDFLNKECNNYDFFYTIRAESNIIGGASAGAAIAVLTAAHLSDTTIDNRTAITGTINSGAIVGPVANIKEKINAASKEGIKKVLIPEGSALVEEDNKTISLYNYSKSKNITLLEISTLDEALFEFTGKHFREKNGEIDIDESYEQTMRRLAEMLCNRSRNIASYLPKDLEDKNLTAVKLEAFNYTLKSDSSFNNGEYYSAASFCFAANTKYRFLQLFSKNMTEKEITNAVEDLAEKIELFEEKAEKQPLNTITDLEAFMVVKERLIDASDSLNKTIKELKKNQTMFAVYNSCIFL